MNNYKKYGIIAALGALALASLYVSNYANGDKDALVISELMAANNSGILADDGKPHDWIEIRNVSDRSASLKGYTLSKDSGEVKWEFPDTIVKPGACVVVFATKRKLAKDLHCDFKLSKKDEEIELATRQGIVASSVKYNHLKDDQALKLTKKGNYKKTYHQTPGFANDEKGYEQYLTYIEQQRRDPLRIWEYMNKNGSKALHDVKGYRWVEIKNTSSKPVDLSEYTLADKVKSKDTISLPAQTLAPGAIILINDTGEKLSGEAVVLLNKGKFADAMSAGQTYFNTSVGRKTSEKGFFFYAEATPGQENTTTAFAEIADKPDFKTAPGVYSKDKKLTVKLKDTDCTVHYTTDGTIPTDKSPVWKDSLVITKTTIIRAFSEKKGCMPSKMVTATYMLGVKHKLPVVSVTMSNYDLHDPQRGIYEIGSGASPEFPYEGANFWKDWERCAHIEFFDGKKGFDTDCGIKIFGAYSRGRDKKSFHIKFRRKYGESSVKYDFFDRGEKYEAKAFVLRSGSQDDNGVMARDEYFTSVMAQQCPTLHVQDYRPVVLYLNGEYFGVYYIREKINEDFVAQHLNVKPKTVTLITGFGSGPATPANYREVMDYVTSHDMRDASAYKWMTDHIDCQSLIDYKIGEYYTGNCDVGNIRYFKSDDKSCNKKWHWLYYDLDWGFYYNTPLRFYIRGNQVRANGIALHPINAMIDRMLQNPDFRKLFLERWAHHYKVTFGKKNALAVFDGIIAKIKPEMERNCQRWPQMSYKTWQANVEKFRAKIVERPDILHQDVMQELGVTAAERKKYFK